MIDVSKLSKLSKSAQRSIGAVAAVAASTAKQIAALEAKRTAITNKVNDVSNKINAAQDKITKKVDDISNKLDAANNKIDAAQAKADAAVADAQANADRIAKQFGDKIESANKALEKILPADIPSTEELLAKIKIPEIPEIPEFNIPSSPPAILLALFPKVKLPKYKLKETIMKIEKHRNDWKGPVKLISNTIPTGIESIYKTAAAIPDAIKADSERRAALAREKQRLEDEKIAAAIIANQKATNNTQSI